MKQEIQPTRAKLLELSRRVRMVKRGHGLLKRKLDSLLLELSNTAAHARALEAGFSEKLQEARDLQTRALMEEGAPRVVSGAIGRMGAARVAEAKVKFMGLSLSRLSLAKQAAEITVQRKAFFSMGTLLAGRAFEGLLHDLVDLASAYRKVHLLLSEVERTRRRVNALEYKVIPETEESVRFIEGHLDEQERESVFRVKRAVNK